MSDSPRDRDAIRALADAATPGPWHLRGRSIQADVQISDDGPADGTWNHSVVCSVGAWRSGRPTDTDAAFIAAARTDVPALLAEVDEYRALFEMQWKRMGEATERWRAEDPEARALIMPDLGNLLRWLMDDADRLRGEVERLDSALTAAENQVHFLTP